jgi:glucosamine 6-phosphate synthetase-like amidotransferase/phosphosugar isomerase protein
MCGIVGYVGSRPCHKVLLAGLRRLEYRGYDSAVLSVVPLQLFADHVARARGLNVDQPRNLAKTVTVQ